MPHFFLTWQLHCVACLGSTCAGTSMVLPHTMFSWLDSIRLAWLFCFQTLHADTPQTYQVSFRVIRGWWNLLVELASTSCSSYFSLGNFETEKTRGFCLYKDGLLSICSEARLQLMPSKEGAVQSEGVYAECMQKWCKIWWSLCLCFLVCTEETIVSRHIVGGEQLLTLAQYCSSTDHVLCNSGLVCTCKWAGRRKTSKHASV